MFEKESNLCFFKRIFFLFIIFQFSLSFFSALTVIPASVSLDFQPGFEQILDYQVYGTKPDTTYSIYVKGDLAQYATLNKKELSSDGTFKVFLSLPNSLEKPGRNTLYVGVKEKADEEISGGIGTAIEIAVLVVVYVPYPGRYVEMSFSGSDVNLGDPLDFEIEAINRGKEIVTIYPRIEIFSNNSLEKLETLFLDERVLNLTQKISLHKTFDTFPYNPGRYRGVAILEYNGTSPSRAETFFRLGELSINIRNFTKTILLNGKIQKFNIELESGWNDKIDGVYAEVIFSNTTSNVLSFKTSSTNLNPWEIQTITGYLDTLNFKEGKYDANITLIYYGKDVGKSSSKLVQVEFVNQSYPMTIIVLVLFTGLIVLVTVIIFLLKRKHKNK